MKYEVSCMNMIRIPYVLCPSICLSLSVFCPQTEGYELKVKGEANTMDYRAFFNQASRLPLSQGHMSLVKKKLVYQVSKLTLSSRALDQNLRRGGILYFSRRQYETEPDG